MIAKSLLFRFLRTKNGLLHTNINKNMYLAVPSSTQRYYSMKTNENEAKQGKLIYEGSENKRLTILQSICSTGSIAIVVAYPKVVEALSSSSIATIIMSASMGILFVQPIGIYAFVRKYVQKLYHDEENDKYTALVPSWHVWPSKRITFSPADCRMPKNPTMFTSFLVKKRPLFVNSDTMNYKEYMNMLRYADGFDFENPERQQDHLKSVLESLRDKNNNNKDKE